MPEEKEGEKVVTSNSLENSAKPTNTNDASFIQLVVWNVPFSQCHRYLHTTQTTITHVTYTSV